MPDWVVERIPRFKNAELIPQRYDDSTHELWRLETNEPESDASALFLKICNNTSSPFWQIMQHLFGFKLTAEINNFEQLYSLIAKSTSLEIPQISKAETVDDNKAFILTSELKGFAVDKADVTHTMVEQLAEHLAALHQLNYSNWGSMISSNLQNREWPDRLSVTLGKFAGTSEVDIPGEILLQALDSSKSINTESFIPMIMDLRWDQFHQCQGELSALLDLDAFVLAPRELEFVFLEYILTAEQCSHFKKIYSNHHAVPELSNVRPAYRLLLFLMQVLGENNIQAWMNKENHF